jgi:probable H4MPT-linked C1 transfer pathway protein
MTPGVVAVTGWDVGGVNTKVARAGGGKLLDLLSVPFEIQHAPGELTSLITRLARAVGSEPTDHHAVTMTAELSQHFRTKREGVAFILDAFERALPGRDIQVFGTDAAFRTPGEARLLPLVAAASNWVATATLVAIKWPETVFVDVGTTTTDIIPIHGGIVAARGRTDPDRLSSAELLYLGALRTPVEAIVSEVPLGDSMAGVSAESFALAGDVYLWLGELAAADYTVPTPDGRAADRLGARDRLARVVCADGEMLDDAAIDAIARHVARVQAERVARSLERVIAYHPSISSMVTAGIGSFIARRAAVLVRPSAPTVHELGTDFTPAAAVALLLESRLNRSLSPVGLSYSRASAPVARSLSSRIRTVVKIGGALLGREGALDIVVPILSRVAERGDPVLVVPGGGPFADAVRRIDTEIGLSVYASHWMATLALDQYAELLASRIPLSRVVRSAGGALAALATGELPILAPSDWLRSADPLPHSWDVTSDSIAAWVAGQVGAERLVLAKASKVDLSALVDPHFARALPEGVAALIVEPVELADALGVS